MTSKPIGSAVFLLAFLVAAGAWAGDGVPSGQSRPRLAYMVSDLRIPFWSIMSRGIQARAARLGYQVTVHSAANDARKELEAVVGLMREGVAGLVVSPTNSSACVTVLKFAKAAGIPVVIADIGTDAGEYVAYISSDNREGAYRIGKILAAELKRRGWQDGSVGIVAIPQKRANGQARTAGFMKALEEEGIRGGGLLQQKDFSYRETFDHSSELIRRAPDLRAIWLQGSDRYQAALDAIAKAGRTGEILLVTFDAEPEFPDLIRDGVLVGAGMQQPFLIGEKAVDAIHAHLRGKPVEKSQRLPVLAVSRENVGAEMETIRRNVLGLTGE